MPELIGLTNAFKGITVHPSFKQIVNQFASQPYFVKNKKGEFIYANSIFINHCRGRSLESILGKTDFDFFPTLVAEKYEKNDTRVFNTGKPIFNLLELAHDVNRSPVCWLNSHKVPLFDQAKNVCGLIGTFEFISNDAAEADPKIAALIPAVNYIRENYRKRIDMISLSESCKMSERTFYRHFREIFGTTPQNYLQKHRILEALELFRVNELAIAAVAVQCGFYDHSNFTKEFKKHMSMTPTKYLQQMA